MFDKLYFPSPGHQRDGLPYKRPRWYTLLLQVWTIFYGYAVLSSCFIKAHVSNAQLIYIEACHLRGTFIKNIDSLAGRRL